KSGATPACSGNSRQIRCARACTVLIWAASTVSLAGAPLGRLALSSDRIRERSSAAARSVKVTATISSGSSPSLTCLRKRWANMCVLPVPAPATTATPPSASTARRWSGRNPSPDCPLSIRDPCSAIDFPFALDTRTDAAHCVESAVVACPPQTVRLDRVVARGQGCVGPRGEVIQGRAVHSIAPAQRSRGDDAGLGQRVVLGCYWDRALFGTGEAQRRYGCLE